MALNQQQYRLSSTVVTEAGQADHFEANFSIQEKPQDPPVPFTLDDLQAAITFLKNTKNIPGTARITSAVAWPMVW